MTIPSLPVLTRACALACVLMPALRLHGADDIVIADFEGDTYGAWTTTGEAFGAGPARGALPGQMAVHGFKGKGLVNSFTKGDASTGTLSSPVFTIERPVISFLIGGGRDAQKLSLDLLIDGQVVRQATGLNDAPGGSENLEAQWWDVSGFVGKPAMIRITDQATGGWGHINVDHLLQSERKPATLIANASRVLAITKRYLHLPIRNGAPKRVVTTLVDGRAVVRNDIELADGQADWWAFVDVGAFIGKELTLRVDKLPDTSTALSAITQDDAIIGAESLYREPLRGQFHFSSRRGWLNDPNGMVFFNGEYHLFYQHNPYGTGWGNMHWGHAVSRDLAHWQELPIVLAPDESGPMFSGSAVVDWNNTSGLGSAGKPPLVLIYTAAGNPTVQSIASSTDGRTFTKYAGNPVLKQISGGNRDPKVMWHEPTKRWLMVLYVERPGKLHSVHILTSPNLREWTLASISDGGIDGDKYLYECPDFFELAVAGGAGGRKWVLIGADDQYATGLFDGTTFTAEQSRLRANRGRGFYAAQTFCDIPAADGRRIQIGWFQTGTPGMPFNQTMTIPLELTLAATPDGPRLAKNPVKELAGLRVATKRVDPLTLAQDGADPLAGITGELVELRAEFTPGDAREIVFGVRGATIVYDVAKQELVVNNQRAPAPLRDGRQRLVVFCDRMGLEVFASDGLAYIPLPFIPKAENRALGVKAVGVGAKLLALEVHELGSIWK